MRRIDALHLEYPFAGSRMLLRVAPARRPCRGPPACRHADEADGDYGALSAPEPRRTRPRATRFTPIC